MKKVSLVLLALALSAGLVFANGASQSGAAPAKSSAPAAKKATVNFATWWGDAEQVFGKALVQDFKASHPDIDVVENYIPYNDFSSKMNTMIAAHQTPDVYILQEYLVNEWGEKGVGADLTPYFQKAGHTADSIWLSQYLFKTSKGLWGIGTGPAVMVLYYNKDLFKKAGIEPPPTDVQHPWTWQQFVDAAKKLTVDKNGKTPNDPGFDYNNVVQWGTMLPTNWLAWCALLYGADTTCVNADGTGLEMAGDVGTNVIQSAADLALKDKVAPTFAAAQGTAFSNTQTLLMNNQLAMYINGTFSYGEFGNEKYDVGMAQIPSFSGKGNTMTWAAGFQMKNGASDAAFTFLTWYMNFNNWMDCASKHNISLPNLIPTTKSTFDDPTQYAKYSKLLPQDIVTTIKDLLQKGTHLGENVTVKNWAVLTDQNITPEFQKVWMGSETAAQAMQNLNKSLQGKFQGVWK
jgi:multiple sugar transport system substrate-binding protein